MNTRIQQTDEGLLMAWKNGQSEAMSTLYERYTEKVYNKCISFAKDEAQAYDLAQDALLKAFDKAHTFRGNASFSTWLYSIVYNHCVDFSRKSKRYSLFGAVLEDGPADDDSTLEYELELDRKWHALEGLLSELPAEDREMLLAKYRDNCSVADIMQRWNLNASAVKMRLLRARDKVRARYAQQVWQQWGEVA